MAAGVYKVHARGCPARKDVKRNDECTCRRPTWQAHVRGRVKGDPPLRKHFKTKGEAVAWRNEMGEAVRNGTVSTVDVSRRYIHKVTRVSAGHR